ncbi:MAG: HD domain-containing phosphohydrolase [Dehalococcoidia bacterium]
MGDGHLTPVFNPNAEAHAMQSLNAVMVIFQTAQRPIGPEGLVELEHSLARLVDCLFPIAGNDADFAGFAPLPGGHYVHPTKTAEAAVLLGRATGMPRSRLITVATAAALMNVGFMMLKQSVLEEPRNLMDGQWEQQMHTHPAHSIAALAASGLSHEATLAIGQHHERWDGSGYPHAVSGNDICVEARIVAIADDFITLRSQRPQEHPMTAQQALQAIRDGAGQLYEPGLVDAFVDVINTYGEKEPRASNSGSASEAATAESAAAAQRGQQAQQSDADASRAKREAAEPDGDETVARSHAGAFTRPSARPAPPAYGIADGPQRTLAPTETPRTSAGRRTRAIARTKLTRRSLFSTDVYLRGATGRWLD